MHKISDLPEVVQLSCSGTSIRIQGFLASSPVSSPLLYHVATVTNALQASQYKMHIVRQHMSSMNAYVIESYLSAEVMHRN